MSVDSSEEEAGSPPPPPPSRKATATESDPSVKGSAAWIAAQALGVGEEDGGGAEKEPLQRLSSRVELLTPQPASGQGKASPDGTPGARNLAGAMAGSQLNGGRDGRLSQVIASMKAKLENMWLLGIDPKTKLRWINSDATVATKASEVLNLPSSAGVLKGEADRYEQVTVFLSNLVLCA